MSADIRISVVLASYNGAAYIDEQLRSLLASLGEHDEIIVSDDASDDSTVQVARCIADPRLTVHAFDERVGYQRNFERAIRAARGRYIFFSDQDDHCLPNRIPESLAALARTSTSCVCGDASLVDNDMRPTADSFFALRGARSFTARRLFVRPAIIGATVACQRDFLLDAMPFPLGVPHDHWLTVLAAARGQLVVVRQPFILYRRHAAAVSLTGSTGRGRSLSTIFLERWRLLASLLRYGMKRLASRSQHDHRVTHE